MKEIKMSNIIISDPTLRDGSHAISHKLLLNHIAEYCKLADSAGIDIIEVGHGNGLGASSLQLGFSSFPDEDMLKTAKNNLPNTKLGIHVIPGFAKLHDIKIAVSNGVDVIRVASHCTEADTTQRYIEYARSFDKTVYGVLMMSHMASKEELLVESRKMISYGAQGIILMDSAGAYLQEDVKSKIDHLDNHLDVLLGFHAHNNLGLAIANTLEAIHSGAKLIDATSKGFGAGAGNTPLEIIVAILKKQNCNTNTDLSKIFDLALLTETLFKENLPSTTVDSIMSAIYGIFSGFAKPIKRVALEYKLRPIDIYAKLSKRKVIAGQEDLIIEVAKELVRK